MVFIARAGRPGLLGMAARTAVVAGTATAVSGAVARNQQRRAMENAQFAQTPGPPAPALAPAAAMPPAAPAAGGDDFLAQVERLAALHQQGILSDEEFALAKQRLLNG